MDEVVGNAASTLKPFVSAGGKTVLQSRKEKKQQKTGSWSSRNISATSQVRSRRSSSKIRSLRCSTVSVTSQDALAILQTYPLTAEFSQASCVCGRARPPLSQACIDRVVSSLLAISLPWKGPRSAYNTFY